LPATAVLQLPHFRDAVCRDTSHRGKSCSATVWLATTVSRLRRSARNDASPVVNERLVSNETYPVRPDTVLPDEPGHLG
jgi:hypothetical protein